MKIAAYAKVNLTLEITGVRDDGYHFLDSVIQSVSLCDIITLNPGSGIAVGCSIPQLDGVGNIAYAAANRFFEITGICGGADIYIEKRIPYPAGLGGGSADAAAVICGLNKLYDTHLSLHELRTAVLSIGSDIPFCIAGGTARVRGIGEVVEQLPPVKGQWMVIVSAGIKKSTAAMYKVVDLKKSVSCATSEFITAMPEKKSFKFCENAFSFAYADSERWNDLKNLGAVAVSISGSGPSLFGIFESENAAKAASAALNCRGIKNYLAETVPYGIKFLT